MGRFRFHPGLIGTFLAVPFLGAAGGALAQTAALKLGAVYQCPAAQSFKVLSCAGSWPADLCDVQSYVQGRPNQHGKSTHQQVMAMLSICHLQTPAEAKAETSGGPGTRAAASPQTGAAGIKVGDTVQIDTAFGWMEARVLEARGNSFRVHAQSGADVWKTYPTELRRIGPLTAEEKASGLYDLHDRVQVKIDGRWVDGEIITTMGQEYQVQIAGNRTLWITAQNLHHVAVAAASPAPKAGQPPKPGLKSCAGKIEGRYASTGGLGSITILFRSGKATMPGLGGDEEFECWMSSDKIYLHKPGESTDQDMPIDINNDGTLQTPMGEIKKRGN